MFDLQAMMKGMSIEWQRVRAKTQLTLGKLISILEAMDQKMMIEGFDNPHSYRGYYEDLAFERSENKIKVSKALKMCRDAMGNVFVGYKGGDFVMGALTPLWISEYGCCGKRFMALKESGEIEACEEEINE